MIVFYVCDDNYAPLLGISLTSLFINNNYDDLKVYIIDDGISDNNKGKIRKTAGRYKKDIRFFKTKNFSFSCKEKMSWPNNIFYRLIFNRIINIDLLEDRVLYLDCDTIVDHDIRNLFMLDMHSNVCAAVLECMGDRHKAKIHLSSSDLYFNSGMILIDVGKWIEFGIDKKAVEVINKNVSKRMEYPDEGIFNYVLKNKIYKLNPEYNLTTIKCIFTYEELKKYRKSKRMYMDDEYKKAYSCPYIIHYTSSFLVTRPWEEGNGYDHPFFEKFCKYKDRSLWKDELVQREKKKFSRDILRFIIRLDRKIGIKISGFLFSSIKPFRYDVMTI